MAERWVWAEFGRDPRDPQYAGILASDVDRDVVHRALARGFAAGQLDLTEFEQRTEQTVSAKTLGELCAPLADLVAPDQAIGRTDHRSLARVGDVHSQAVMAYRKDLREALWGFVSASVITWLVWVLFTRHTIPWPLFVMLGTGLNVGRLVVMKNDQIAGHERRGAVGGAAR